MNRNILFIPMMLILALSLAACVPPTGGPGPRTWIDAPLDGSTLELGLLVVRSHAASDTGTAQAALLVNGAQVRVDQAADSSSPLVEFAQSWIPERPGTYVLQVISTDKAGNEGRSNAVRVQVGGDTLDAATATPAADTATVTPTSTLTPVDVPIFTFGQNSNCREGDSTAYEVVTSFLKDAQVVIEARNSDGSWFLVLIPNGGLLGGGQCWVSAGTGTHAGRYASVRVAAAPPLPPTETPEPAQPPAAPGNLHIAGEVCSAQEFKVTLEWGNVSGEDGYRVYRDGQLIATLGPNATGYTDSPPDYNAHTYGVEAFNAGGTSARPTVQEDGCLF